MELQPCERFPASGACLPRWRPTTEYMGHVQQVSQPVGMVGGGAESKFMVDDSVLTDLLDLDPVNDQLFGEPSWMGNNNNNSNNHHGEQFTNGPQFPPTTSSHMSYPYGNAAACLQEYFDSSLPAMSTSLVAPRPYRSASAGGLFWPLRRG